MPEKTLFIEIFQPFAQYRNPFTFYYAQTYPLPPKSTIIGMLQNAVGDWYGNNIGVETWWNLKVSVHGGFESVFWNYQNLIKGELGFTKEGIWINRNKDNPGGNIWMPLYNYGITSQRSPVYQQELFNGHLYIFVKGDSELIEKIKKALESPNKVLYLGRSEDVIFIKKVKEIEIEKKISVEGDIEIKYPTYILQDKFPIKNKKYPVYSIPTKIIFENNGQTVKHKAEITKKTERKTEFTTVIYTGYDYAMILKEDSKLYVEFYKIQEKEVRIFSEAGWL